VIDNRPIAFESRARARSAQVRQSHLAASVAFQREHKTAPLIAAREEEEEEERVCPAGDGVPARKAESGKCAALAGTFLASASARAIRGEGKMSESRIGNPSSGGSSRGLENFHSIDRRLESAAQRRSGWMPKALGKRRELTERRGARA